MRKLKLIVAAAVVLSIVASACGGSSDEAESPAPADEPTVEVSEPTSTPEPVPPTAEPKVADEPEPTDIRDPTVEPEPVAEEDEPQIDSALDTTGEVVTVDWDSLVSTPFFSPAAEGAADPLFLIHTDPDADGFFLSFEMYTTGYGQEWAGETGTFDISCADPVASTGICPYFDPDGAGPEPVLGEDFAAQGSLTIVQLDAGGYEIVVHELTFSDGTSFDEFVMTG